MNTVQVIHNPGSGDESHNGEKLVKLIEQAGYKSSYVSTKEKGWKDFDRRADLLAIAGGDGTVRKVARQILDDRLLDKPEPIALLPLGTANNISKALKIEGSVEELVQSWKSFRTKSFDVGRIYNVPDARFFLESFGYGVFPYLMLEMKNREEESSGTPEEKLQKGLSVMHEIIQNYKPRHCRLEVDGTDYSGEFILAEVMNIPSIGPNLAISPLSDPSDGEFEVVLVTEQQKNKFLDYIEGKIGNREDTYSFHTLKGRKISISWEGTHVHVDDQVVKLEKGAEVNIQLKQGLIEFLVKEK